MVNERRVFAADHRAGSRVSIAGRGGRAERGAPQLSGGAGQTVVDQHAPASGRNRCARRIPAKAATIPQASGKLVVLPHGLRMNDLHWKNEGHEAPLDRAASWWAYR